MKFILKAKDENMTLTVFKNQPAGKVHEENAQKQKSTNVHFDSSMVYYRNDYIQQIVNFLINSQNKIVEVTGVRGVGKNAIVKAAAGYIVDRNFFPDGVFLLHMDPELSCIQQVGKYVDTKIDNEEDLISKLKTRQILLILVKNEDAEHQYFSCI